MTPGVSGISLLVLAPSIQECSQHSELSISSCVVLEVTSLSMCEQDCEGGRIHRLRFTSIDTKALCMQK